MPTRQRFPFLLHRTMAEVNRTQELTQANRWRSLTKKEVAEIHRLARRMHAAGIGPSGIGVRQKPKVLRARPVKGPVDHTALSREFMTRYPNIRKRLAE